MGLVEEIKTIWQTFDEGHKHSNDSLLMDGLVHVLDEYGGSCNRDKEMYRRLLDCVNDAGFLVKEEKQFLTNYAVFLVSQNASPSEKPKLLNQMRDSSSILDVWPDKQGIRADYSSGGYRKEALLWFIRMYEVLGNAFLRKRNYFTEYYGIDLARVLESEKCKLKENEYAAVAEFFDAAELFITGNVQMSQDKEQSIKLMRKLIWKIREGITKYS